MVVVGQLLVAALSWHNVVVDRADHLHREHAFLSEVVRVESELSRVWVEEDILRESHAVALCGPVLDRQVVDAFTERAHCEVRNRVHVDVTIDADQVATICGRTDAIGGQPGLAGGPPDRPVLRVARGQAPAPVSDRAFTNGRADGLTDLDHDLVGHGRLSQVTLALNAHLQILEVVHVGVVGENFEFSRTAVEAGDDVKVGLLAGLAQLAAHAAAKLRVGDARRVGPLWRIKVVRESGGLVVALSGISSERQRRSAVTSLFLEGEHILAALGVRVLQAGSVRGRVSIPFQTDLAVVKELMVESIRRVRVSTAALTRAAKSALE